MQHRRGARKHSVSGVSAPPPRPTLVAASLLAVLFSLPFLAIALVELALTR
ncbi:hypothetical protein [Mesobacterium pallidum]|uniref:hypothetical protein n=1 Tax=Mesobacterium pallidum TaxID=2872037 RepID=UPI001EE2170F|nr:hypothetical protein [Mesobacterium pallidum]